MEKLSPLKHQPSLVLQSRPPNSQTFTKQTQVCKLQKYLFEHFKAADIVGFKIVSLTKLVERRTSNVDKGFVNSVFFYH